MLPVLRLSLYSGTAIGLPPYPAVCSALVMSQCPRCHAGKQVRDIGKEDGSMASKDCIELISASRCRERPSDIGSLLDVKHYLPDPFLPHHRNELKNSLVEGLKRGTCIHWYRRSQSPRDSAQLETLRFITDHWAWLGFLAKLTSVLILLPPPFSQPAP